MRCVGSDTLARHPRGCGCGAGRRLGGAERTTATQSGLSGRLCRHEAREIVPRGRAQPKDLRRGRAPYARVAQHGRRTVKARRGEGRKEARWRRS